MLALARTGVLLLAAVAGASGLAAAQERCTKCRSQRLLPCKEHGKLDLGGELAVLYCSVVDGCQVCGGGGWIDCAACEAPAEEGRLAARRAAVAPAREHLAELDRQMGRPLRKAESAHFVLVWEMRGMKVEKRPLDEHQMLHLTLERLERLYADYVQLFGVRESAFEKKSSVYVWFLPSDHERASLAFCDVYAESGSKLMGTDTHYSVCGNVQYFLGDEHLHRNIMHCATHLLFSHEAPSQWIGNLQGGWLDEGLAHFFEDRYFGRCDTYCYQEQNTQFDFKGGRFKLALRTLAEAGVMPPVAGTMRKNTDQLKPAEHALALALVDFLIQLDSKKLSQLGRKLRARAELREALEQVYGFSILELEARLRAWVIETYPVTK